MKQLDLYLGKTVGMMMLMASLGLIGLFVIFTFLEQMEDIENDYTMFMVMNYVVMSIPRIFYETLPYATLIGCLAGLGLLANNSELIVMRSSGISTWQITWATLKPALALVVIGLLVGEFILPDVERDARVIRKDAMEDDITPDGGFWYRENNIYMQFNAVSHEGQLSDINQYTMTDDKQLISSLWAEKAIYNDGSWQLHNVVETNLKEGRQQEHHDMLEWSTELTPQILNTEILVEPDRMSILELNRKIKHMQAQGLNTGKFELGFWLKLFQPVASLSLVFIAISFIFGPLRETTMGMRVVSGLVIGIVFKFVQDLLSPASLVFGFSPLIATLIPILACLIIGAYLLRRAN
jgi:lipopolysaccharide export system permease protein